MKTYVSNLITCATIAALLCGLPGFLKADPGDTTCHQTIVCHLVCPCEGPTREFIKTISRDFGTSANGTTAIYNRHGDINIRTWTENKVKINITIVVNAYDPKEAEVAMGQINANFTNTNGYIKAETMIGNLNSWGGKYYDILDNNVKKCQDYRINYEVWIPIDNQLDIQNKYGASYIANLNGRLVADIRYGDLRVENLKSEANIKIEGGKATLANTPNLFGQVSSGEIVVENAGDIQMDTRNSNCTFRRATNVRLTSRYDDIALGKIGNLRLQAKYSDFTLLSAQTAFITAQYSDAVISNIGLQLDADFQNGDLMLERINHGFDLVNLIGNTANFVITRAPGVSYRYMINGNNTQMNFAAVPNNAKAISRVASNLENSIVKEGLIGNDSHTRSALKARMVHGSISLK